ncbi:adenylate/guanylate cyclase domain-containing protein [Maridesulfovibrio sp.]|uniref:adenylate/guanylate cyclase domain-containing protein n=1 Tax=Maridesulfovibrio sp. TaxID=2795000 RepID=UPI0029F5A249|nr:adenylate/guanylate cyclase domain-containing protein [Maridesulfovibrio sp.]
MKKTHTLYVNILSIFITLISAVVLCVVFYGYIQNSSIALFSAKQLVRQTGSAIGERTENIFDSAFMTVNTYIGFNEIEEKPSIHSHPMSNAFFKCLQEHKDFTSIFIGFSDGDFYLVSSLRNRDKMKKEKNIPPEAQWYTQTIGHLPNGERYELTRYLNEGFVTIGSSSSVEADYDPRKRNWFIEAQKTDRAILSDIYIFALSGEPGITVSRRFDAHVPGTLGVDLSLANLSEFMKRQLVGEGCEIMIYEPSGDLYGYHDMEKLSSSLFWNADRSIARPKVTGLKSKVLNTLVANHEKNTGDHLRIHQLIVDGKRYISLIDPLPKEYGKELFVAITVPESFFTGPIAKIGTNNLLVSLGIFMLFLPVIHLVAKQLSKPLIDLTSSVNNIKQFNLEIPVDIKSNIIEVRDLSKATETMRKTLNSFGKYVPRPLVQSMMVNKITPRLGGGRKQLTFMFTDIKDFTSISETMSPEQLTRTITSYLKCMSRVILKNKGTIDKYIGDGIMAFWNAPVADKNHARNGCMAALYCREALKKFNKHCRDNNKPEMITRMGVHTGEAVVGNIGSADRMDYTAMGAAVNLASRLEGLNKYLGTEILVSDATKELAGADFLFRYAGRVLPKGTIHSSGVYELLGLKTGTDNGDRNLTVSTQQESMVKQWAEALGILMDCDYEKAAAAFESYIQTYGPDPLADYYRELSRKFVLNPPAENWQGEIVFNAK